MEVLAATLAPGSYQDNVLHYIDLVCSTGKENCAQKWEALATRTVLKSGRHLQLLLQQVEESQCHCMIASACQDRRSWSGGGQFDHLISVK